MTPKTSVFVNVQDPLYNIGEKFSNCPDFLIFILLTLIAIEI